MASFDPDTLTAALDGAMMVGTNHYDTFGAPQILPASDGEDGKGAFIVLVSKDDDMIDIFGQMAARGWRVQTSVCNEAAGYVAFMWHRS